MDTPCSKQKFGEITLTDDCPYSNWNEFRPPNNRPISPSFALFRLLLGGTSIEYSNIITKQRFNHMAIGAPERQPPFLLQRIKAAFPTLGEQAADGSFLLGTALPSLKSYFNDPGGNHGFFNSLFDEISRTIHYSNCSQGLAAFVHLYRALEKLSFAFPLYHARQNNNYLKAYEQLKKYFKSGELDFCSNFIKEILNQNNLAASDNRSLLFKYNFTPRLKSYFKEHSSGVSAIYDNKIEIKIIDAFDFIVTLRNHYFHHLSGSNFSLESRDIPYSDDFFLAPVQLGLGLIGIIYARMIEDAI